MSTEILEFNGKEEQGVTNDEVWGDFLHIGVTFNLSHTFYMEIMISLSDGSYFLFRLVARKAYGASAIILGQFTTFSQYGFWEGLDDRPG